MTETTPKRVQRSRSKGAKLGDAVYVGRGSKWGNPFEVGSVVHIVVQNKRNKLRPPQEQTMTVTPELACVLYRERIVNLIEQLGVPKISELRGKDLACWCSLDQPCHADILLELANAKR